MSNLISKKTAYRIWIAYHEIETGELMLRQIKSALSVGEDPNPLDWRGERRPYSLGVPVSDGNTRLVDVEPRLAAAIIESHIAAKRLALKDACIAAGVELGGER